MKRGEVWWADLGAYRPREQTGRRPVVIWQSDALTRILQSVLVIPLTTNVDRAHLAGTAIIAASAEGPPEDSVALAFQLRAIPKAALQTRIRSLTDGELAELELATDVGHEGTHVSDLRREFAGAGTLSDFSLEYRGYETSAFVFQGLFTPSLAANQGTVIGGIASRTLSYGGSVIWNTSWGAADKAAIQSRDVGITNAVRSIYGHAETTPHNPWGN